MKKLILIAALLVSTPAYAGYDISTESFPNPDYPDRPYTVDVEDDGLDFDSYTYFQYFDTDTGESGLIPTSEIPGLGDQTIAVSGTTAATCNTNGLRRVNVLAGSTNSTVTLPAATGTGCVYKFVWAAVPAASGDIIQVTGDDSFNGVFVVAQDGGDTIVAFETASDTDKLTFTSSTKYASKAGISIEFTDYATDKWMITDGIGAATGTEATPGATGQRP